MWHEQAARRSDESEKVRGARQSWYHKPVQQESLAHWLLYNSSLLTVIMAVIQAGNYLMVTVSQEHPGCQVSGLAWLPTIACLISIFCCDKINQSNFINQVQNDIQIPLEKHRQRQEKFTNGTKALSRPPTWREFVSFDYLNKWICLNLKIWLLLRCKLLAKKTSSEF